MTDSLPLDLTNICPQLELLSLYYTRCYTHWLHKTVSDYLSWWWKGLTTFLAFPPVSGVILKDATVSASVSSMAAHVKVLNVHIYQKPVQKWLVAITWIQNAYKKKFNSLLSLHCNSRFILYLDVSPSRLQQTDHENILLGFNVLLRLYLLACVYECMPVVGAQEGCWAVMSSHSVSTATP